MHNPLLRRAIRTFEKFDEGVSNSEGFEGMTKPGLKHVKMMITADDDTSFMFDCVYNKEGEVASNFAILQTDANGKVRQVPIELFKERSEKEEEVPDGVLLN